MPLDNAPIGIGHRELEDVLCQIHCDSRSIHLGLLLVRCSLNHTDSAWHIDAVLPSRRSPSQHKTAPFLMNAAVLKGLPALVAAWVFLGVSVVLFLTRRGG